MQSLCLIKIGKWTDNINKSASRFDDIATETRWESDLIFEPGSYAQIAH